MEENKELKVENTEEKEVKGWREVEFSANMPLAALVEALNILNQRLCNVEDNVMIKLENGTAVPLTEIYANQAKEMKAEENTEDQKDTSAN